MGTRMKLIVVGTLAISVWGLPAAQFGESSIRKSINFGPHLAVAHHSVVNPSLQLTAFNAEPIPVMLTADCAAHLDPALCAAHAIAQAFLAALHPAKQFKLVDSYISSHNGVLHQHYLSLHHGLVIANANLNLNIDTLTGQVISYGDSSHSSNRDSVHAAPDHVPHQVIFNDNVPQSATPHDPLHDSATPDFHHLTPNDPRHGLLSFLAQQSDSSNFALLLPSVAARQELHHSMQLHQESTTAFRIHNAPTTHAPVPATLVYILDQNQDLKLSYKYEIRTQENQYEAYVQADATIAGEEQVYMTVDWVRDFRPTKGEMGAEGLITASRETRAQSSNFNINAVVASDEDVFTTASPVNVSAKPSYKVFPWGTNAPDEGAREVLVGTTVELDSIASPAGWHSISTAIKVTNFTDTRGNNVFAQENWDGGNTYVNHVRPDAGSNMSFQYPIHLPKAGHALDPKSYINASVTELFYTCNEMHDLFYRYGFDEVAGNFQETNFGRGGLGNDAVQANSQDGSGVNNANFATPGDGGRPRMRMFYWNQQQPYRDGAFEAGIVIHEYSHGISTRLTGGPANSGCLGWGEAGGEGEGYGDVFATLIRQHQANETDFSMGEWASGRVGGIRNFRYSRNMTINKDTFKSLDQPAYYGVHAIGEVWAEMLFEMAENLIIKHGFASSLFPIDASFYNDKYAPKKVPKHGNTLAIQLIIDGMKLQPCRPSFVNARDAILTADNVLTNGDNACLIWKAFAKRGLGVKASRISTPWGPGKATEDYSVPLKCSTK